MDRSSTQNGVFDSLCCIGVCHIPMAPLITAQPSRDCKAALHHIDSVLPMNKCLKKRMFYHTGAIMPYNKAGAQRCAYLGTNC